MFWRESGRYVAGGAAAGWSGACDYVWEQSVCVRVQVERACLRARVHLFCPASCFSDATSNCVSWATRGPCYVFFLPVLAGNANQLLCCCHRSGEVCFLSTFIPGTSPSTVTVETRPTPTLFPSMSPSFNDLSLLSFFLIRCTAPTYQHFSSQWSI